jgi:hypothetical protein
VLQLLVVIFYWAQRAGINNNMWYIMFYPFFSGVGASKQIWLRLLLMLYVIFATFPEGLAAVRMFIMNSYHVRAVNPGLTFLVGLTMIIKFSVASLAALTAFNVVMATPDSDKVIGLIMNFMAALVLADLDNIVFPYVVTLIDAFSPASTESMVAGAFDILDNGLHVTTNEELQLLQHGTIYLQKIVRIGFILHTIACCSAIWVYTVYFDECKLGLDANGDFILEDPTPNSLVSFGTIPHNGIDNGTVCDSVANMGYVYAFCPSMRDMEYWDHTKYVEQYDAMRTVCCAQPNPSAHSAWICKDNYAANRDLNAQ